MSTADDTAPAPALSDGPPLDAAQRLGLARFRLGPDAPPWLMETLAFARDEVARLTRERDEARADGAREMRERAAAEAMRGNGGVTHAELATIHAVAAKSLAGALDTPEARIAYLLEAHPHAGACELVAWLIRALPIVEVPA